jgi:hypothetical protein
MNPPVDYLSLLPILDIFSNQLWHFSMLDIQSNSGFLCETPSAHDNMACLFNAIKSQKCARPSPFRLSHRHTAGKYNNADSGL